MYADISWLRAFNFWKQNSISRELKVYLMSRCTLGVRLMLLILDRPAMSLFTNYDIVAIIYLVSNTMPQRQKYTIIYCNIEIRNGIRRSKRGKREGRKQWRVGHWWSAGGQCAMYPGCKTKKNLMKNSGVVPKKKKSNKHEQLLETIQRPDNTQNKASLKGNKKNSIFIRKEGIVKLEIYETKKTQNQLCWLKIHEGW